MKLADLISAPLVTPFELECGDKGFVRLLTIDQRQRYDDAGRSRNSSILTGQMSSDAKDITLLLIRWGVCNSDGSPWISSDDEFLKLKNSPASSEIDAKVNALAMKVMEHNGLGQYAQKKT